MRRVRRGRGLIAIGIFLAGITAVITQVLAEEASPPVQAETDVQSRGFSLPNMNVPPPPPPPSMQPLTVRTTGEGNGKVTFPPANACPPGCGTNYPKGTPVVIAAVPAPGSTFAGWGGDCRGTAPCTLTMDRAKTVEAKFNRIQAPSAAAPTQWSRWSQAAAGAARQEAVKWLKGASIDGALCKIHLGYPQAPPGVLKSRYTFTGLVKQALQQAGASETVAREWDTAFKNSWDTWATQVSILPTPPLLWYPTFLAMPFGAYAPPIPNAPSPLSALVSPGMIAMSPPRLAGTIQTKIGIPANQPDAKAAISIFANDLSARFGLCMRDCLMTNVMGSGQALPQSLPPAQPVMGNCSGGMIIVSGF
ncbi:MAG: hypothetical protein HOP35_12330 [Nitrospira sp.]|nr:hypothetical protein [Nitrospira sp.]